MLVWIDLETTGLEPRKDSILEIACILTDDNLVELVRFNRVIFMSQYGLEKSAEYVKKMHKDSGLWDAVLASSNTAYDAEQDLIELLSNYGKLSEMQLAGSTVNFERAFFKEHMPDLLENLHYRSVDVTTFKEVARRIWPELYNDMPTPPSVLHRAMSDIEYSIECMKYFTQNLWTAERLTTPFSFS